MSTRIQYTGSAIRSLQALASTLSCDADRLKYIARNISSFYDIFSREKKSGGARFISAPKKELKTIQKRINSRIFCYCVFPVYLQGSVKDDLNPRDFVSNATLHAQGKFFVLADISDFFPSINAKYVNNVFRYLFRFSPEVSELLVALTTLDGSLPQGAPTSSCLANLIFYDSEHVVARDFIRDGLMYSRLIDDISVSSAKILDKGKVSHIIKKISGMVSAKGMRLHQGKLRILDSRGCGVTPSITGLNIEKGAPRLPLLRRKEIRHAVYLCKKDCEAGHRTSSSFHEAHNSVSGRVALMTRLGYAASEKYRETLRGCLPHYDLRRRKKLSALCHKFAQKKGSGADTVVYARKYHKYMYHLGVLSRTNPSVAKELKSLLRMYRPTIKLNQVEAELL